MPTASPPRQAIRFGVFEVDLRAGELRRKGIKLRLQEQPFQVLAQLLARPGEVVSREELKQALWPEDTFVDFDHSLNTTINKLREALGDGADNPRFVETLPRRGYRFIAPVEILDGGPRAAARLWAGLRPTLAVAGVALLLVAASYWAWQEFQKSAAGPPGRVMLAVLPFENLSGDPQQEYFSDGLTEEMITELGRLQPKRLGVIARTSVMQYKGTRKPAQQIGRELGADYLLEGSVRREGERVRISAQLVQVSDQTHLWAQSYDRPLSGILALQTEAARAIATEIRVKVTSKEQVHLARVRPVNPAAHDAYLKGRYHANQFSPDGFAKAIQYFEEAVRIDPGYALGYAGLGDVYTTIAALGALPSKDLYPKAKGAAQKALDLDETLAEAHVAMGWTRLSYEWDWKGAEREFQWALELNPGSVIVRYYYSIFLSVAGQHEQAIAEAKRALEIDPLSLLMITNLGWRYLGAQQDDQAVAQFRRTLEMDPNFGVARENLARIYLRQGRHREALAELEKLRQQAGDLPVVLVDLGHTYGVMGRKAEARKVLQQLEQLSRRSYVSPYFLAAIHAGLGEKDEAFARLDQAYQERDIWLILIQQDTRFDALHSDPRFQDLLRRMNFPE